MLRGINVGGQKSVKMAELEKMYASLGYGKVRTYIQSGNVVFECGENPQASLEKTISSKIKSKFGFDVAVIVRTPADLEKIIQGNPFKGKDEGRMYVSFLSATPSTIPTEAIGKAKGISEEYFISGKEIYMHFPDGYGRTKLSNNFFESKLKVASTTRNWNTVGRLLEIAKKA